MKTVLIKSKERFDSFQKKLHEYKVHTIVLDFHDNSWLDFDFKDINFVIYYPSFGYSANHPLALWEVYDNLMHIKSLYKNIYIYPDPQLIQYYNDKYRQHLFLKSNKHPIPLTIPLLSISSLKLASDVLGYPMVIKNRYGAGGSHVYKISNEKELELYFRISIFDFYNLQAIKYFGKLLTRRLFYYHLIKEKRCTYPFLSPPLLAQKFIDHERDLKLVLNRNKVIEGHWREKVNEKMWKVNIDGGGIGEWSYIPESAFKIAQDLAKTLNSDWLNIDLFETENGFLISEFSPVWHHYAYKEKPSFVYKDDYNLNISLESALDLEKIIIESLILECRKT